MPFPEVRGKAISLIEEMAQYPVDGVSHCVQSQASAGGIPEPPVVDSFRKLHGADPVRIDDKDPRWLRHRAGVLTQFMRELRTALTRMAQQQKRKPYELTAIVLGTEQENLYNAIDLQEWIHAGLVDTIVPYTSRPNLRSSEDSFANPAEADFFVRIPGERK